MIFECFAEAKGISQPECLLEFLELCYDDNLPLVAFDNNQSSLKDTIEDLKKFIANSNNEAGHGYDLYVKENTGVIKPAPENSYKIECVKGEDKWLDPYNFDELPFVGRDYELKLLDEFVNQEDQFKIWAIAGPSGAGKTRLACQWAHDSDALINWDCRILHKEDRTEPEQWANWSPNRPSLIIIDYLFGFEEVVLNLMGRCLRPTEYKVRLLLIDHVFSAPLHNDERWGFSGDGSSLNRNEKYFFNLQPLDLTKVQEQEKIIKKIIARRAGIDEKDSQVEIARAYLLKAKGAYYPLFAALVGDAIKSGKDFRAWNRRELIYYYLAGLSRVNYLGRFGDNYDGRLSFFMIS